MPIFPVAQNLQAIWQPIWEDTQSVDRGMPTLFRSGAAAFLPFCGSYRKITVSTCNPSWSCSSNFMVVPSFETTCRTTWVLVATNLFPIFSIASLGNPGSSPSQVSSLVCLGCRFCTKAWMVVAWDGFLPHSSRYACSRSVSYTELLAASFLRPELDLDMDAAPFAALVDGLGHLGRMGPSSSNLDRRRNWRSNPLLSRVPNRGNRRVCPRDPPVPGWMGSLGPKGPPDPVGCERTHGSGPPVERVALKGPTWDRSGARKRRKACPRRGRDEASHSTTRTFVPW